MLASPSIALQHQHQQQLLATPAMVAFASLLALPGPELEREVANELADNPVLVVDEAMRARVGVEPRLDAGSWDVAATTGWREALTADLRLELAADDAPYAELVVGCLDARGMLAEEPDDVARLAGLDPALATQVLATLRATGPAGVGARDARDAMTLHLLRRPAGDAARHHALEIVSGHLEEAASGRLEALAAALGVTRDQAETAVAYLRQHARPRPSLPAVDVAWVRPDVAFVARPEAPGTFRVEVLERARMAVAVDRDLRDAARRSGDRVLRALADRADAFAARLDERWATLGRVSALIAERQAAFLRDGDTGAVRLTRADVAAALGVHESTVSRATSGKYARLPSGRSVPFAAFFDGATGVRAALAAIVEAAPAPLSDAELGRRLADVGYVVARRTVAKYRGHLGIAAGGQPIANRASRAANPASAPA
jgi:RNA polymerase sigma-54 factor